MIKTKHVYSINDKVGACIIFNMEKFKNNQHRRRDGTEFDRSQIERTFTKIGYDVYQAHNPTKIVIEEKMMEVLGIDHSDSSSFVCFILSHGTTENRIVTFDGLIDLNDIIQMTDVPALQGKPKIFVIQTCRGNNADRGIDERTDGDMNGPKIEIDDLKLVPRKPDLLLIYATPPGYKSYRDEELGSNFIQKFCHILEQERGTATICDLLQRLTMGISIVSFPVRNQEGMFLQVPYFMSTLRKSLILCNSPCSGNIQSMTTNITKDTHADVSRRINERSRDEILHSYEKTNDCYDVSVTTARHCLVINKTTIVNIQKAETDCNLIQETMTALKFKVRISNGSDKLEDTLKEYTAHDSMGCLFCFIQIDADNDTSYNKLVAELIESVKKKRSMLKKPKVYIIQPYQTESVSEADSISDDIKISLTHPISHSKESDVLTVHVLPVKFGKTSFIQMFCSEYVENAGKVPIIGFLERILPEKYEGDWLSLIPTVCSTMRKHLIIKDFVATDSCQSDYNETNGVKDEVDTFPNGRRQFFPKLWQVYENRFIKSIISEKNQSYIFKEGN